MTKKLILPALLFVFAALCTTNSLGQCTTGVNPVYIAVGSSAQFNTFAFAAVNILTNAGNGVNFWASSSEPLTDTNANVTDTAKIWLAWDNQAICNVYSYMSVDSTIGVKDFFSYKKLNVNGVTNADVAAVFLANTATFPACTAGKVINAGQPGCSGATTPPANLQLFLTSQPEPSCKISGTTCTVSTTGALPRPYCGQNSTSQTVAKYCYFNAGHADIRPEDTLYANTRALSSYNSTGGLAGLGYNNTVCGGQGGTTATIGCPFLESFAQGGSFNVVKFGLTGTDPIGGASLPTYTTLPVGAAPILVIVSDQDSAGLGAGAPSNYKITNVNRAILAGIENGTFGCSGDLAYDGSGPGQPLQILHREALSGTYNVFEFTGVRQLEGGAVTAISDNKQTSLTWFTADDSGQEQVAENQGGPSLNFGSCGSASVAPSGACGDPLYATGVACGSNGNAVHLRVIGTGEMVKAVSQGNGLTGTFPATNDAFGYAFWGYGNVAPMGSTCATNTGNDTCGTYLAHYLTVDGIDPLFNTPGGAGDSPVNPNGAYHPPQCYLKGGLPNCFAIPFTHIYDGSYPLWTTLRLVTFNTVTSGTAPQTTPAGVLQVLGEAEAAAANERVASLNNLGDFIPYLKHICPPGQKWTQPSGPCAADISVANYNGDLNLFVLRSHSKVAPNTVNPNNGFSTAAACPANFETILISGAAGTCTVDAGDDMGGAVITVNADVDFNADFGSVSTNPKEYFGLRN